MGRFRKNKTINSDKHQTGGKGRWKKRKNSHNNGSISSPAERKFLRKYLQDYKEGAFALLRGFQPNILSATTRVTDLTQQPHHVQFPSLPALTEEQLRQPYIALPSQLTPKQRRLVHETCTDIGLYHTSVNQLQGLDSDSERYVAVSIFRDGFQCILGWETQQQRQANCHSTFQTLAKLKPWAMQRTVSVKSDSLDVNITDVSVATLQAKEKILQLIDQPGIALRDEIDVLDLNLLKGQDLSQISTPSSFEEEDWFLVDSKEKMEKCVEEIQASATTEIAFDLECYNKSKYVQVTCLIQLAITNGKEYVIDPLAPGVWDTVSLLAPFFMDRNIVKIGHGIGGLDVKSLHRDFGIFVVNAFDTYEAANTLQLSRKGLAKVCEYYGLQNCSIYEDLKSKYQASDWTRRPLTEPMIRYGRYDVHYLVQLRRLMMRDLVKEQSWAGQNYDEGAVVVQKSLKLMFQKFDEDHEDTFVDAKSNITPLSDNYSSYEDTMEDFNEESCIPQRTVLNAFDLRMNSGLMLVISRSQEHCLALWKEIKEAPLQNSDFQNLLLRSKADGKEWTAIQIELYEELARWRDRIAIEEECASPFVCSLGFLASVAFKMPTSLSSLYQITFDLPDVLKNLESQLRLEDLLLLVSNARLKSGLAEVEDVKAFPSFFDSAREGIQKDCIENPFRRSLGVLVCATFALAMFSYGRNRRTRIR